MRRSMARCAVWVAALALAARAGAARADDFETVHPYVLFNPAKPHPLLARFHCQAPVLAWADHNDFGAGSLLSECTFVFGSCRMYYGEPIRKAPPPPPWSPEADQPPAPVQSPPMAWASQGRH
jgi:hypothetical protein